MKLPLHLSVWLFCVICAVNAQDNPAAVFEPSPILDASKILRPEYARGPFFRVRNPVLTYGGLNSYEIDSDFGTFRADGNLMLMRRVAEINAMATLRRISQTKEFKRAAARAASSPLVAAKELVTHPVGTISGVPQGIWKLLNGAGQSVKEIGENRRAAPSEGTFAENLSGFAKVKRKISLELGVDPYSLNEEYQKALNAVAWPEFAGGLTVNIGMAIATAGIGNAGLALSAVNWTGNLNDVLRENNPNDLRLRNLQALLKMGVVRSDAVAFLNNPAISPTAQTVLVAALERLELASGRGAYVRQAATSATETDGFFYAQCAQLMAKVNAVSAIREIKLRDGFPICLSAAGVVAVPLQWDYVAWTPVAAKFTDAVKAVRFSRPPTGYQLVLSGVVSPMAADALASRGFAVFQKQLPNPLRQGTEFLSSANAAFPKKVASFGEKRDL